MCFICRSDTGVSKGSSHSLLKRSTNQHTATSQAVSTDLSAIRLKKAGLMSSVGMGLKLYGSVELSNFDLVNITLWLFPKSLRNLLQCNLGCQLLDIKYIESKLDGHQVVDLIAISTHVIVCAKRQCTCTGVTGSS